MNILPVLDLMQGQIVRGRAGHRQTYRPIESTLAVGAAPQDIAAALSRTFGFEEFYLADLDAIAGAEPNWAVYDALQSMGLRLWIDAGIGSGERCAQLARYRAHGLSLAAVIVALESLPSPRLLDECLNLCETQRLVFSLDLKAGVPLAGSGWQWQSVVHLADQVVQRGVQRMIVLDLANVGMNDGVATLNLCRLLSQRHPQLELSAGGGVRHTKDLNDLATAGCQWALVASALHDGRLTRQELAALNGIA